MAHLSASASLASPPARRPPPSRSRGRPRVASASASAPSPARAASATPSSLPSFEGARAWRGPAMLADASSWTHRLTAVEIAELDAALASARGAGLDVIDLTPETFPLPTLSARLRALRDELVTSRGIHLFRGLPVQRWDSWQRCAAFYGMASHVGWLCPQNAKGHVLGHVKDLGCDPDDPAVRIYTTAAAQPFHTDSADVVGLMCLANGAEGGESQVVSTAAVWNELVATRPELAAALVEPFPVDRKGEVPPGKNPTYDMPVMHIHREHREEEPEDEGSEEEQHSEDSSGSSSRLLLSNIYDRNFIASAQARFAGDESSDGGSSGAWRVPRLTATQTAALDALDALCADPSMHLEMRLEPGDVQWLHNHSTLHARSAYRRRDTGAEGDRHLLRVWVTPPNAVTLPRVFAERFGTVDVGPSRGGIRVEGQVPYCALEPEE